MNIIKKIFTFIFKRNCPLCGGNGIYTSETMARYGDEGIKCECCNGTGKILR